MTNEEKQLLLTDLCARLPYGVIINSEEYNEANYRKHYLQKLISIKILANKLACIDIDDYPDPKIHDWRIELCKPYLRPMESMTKEEKEEFDELTTCGRCSNNYDRWGHWGVEVVSYHYDEMDRPFYDFSQFQDLQNWLNKKGFDYNGLIPMGLALEATEGMYNN